MLVRVVSPFIFCLAAALAFAASAADWLPPTPIAPGGLTSPLPGFSAKAASDGDSFLIVTNDSGRGMRAIPVDADGRIVDGNGIRIDTPAIAKGVAGNGSEWLITDATSAWLLNPRSGAAPPVRWLSMNDPKVVSNGRNFFVWSTNPFQPASAAIVNAADSKIDIDPRALPQSPAAAGSNGNVYCIAAIDDAAIVFNIIDAAGRPVFEQPRKLMDAPLAGGRLIRRIALARVHGNFRLFWTEIDPFFGARDQDVAWALGSAELTSTGDVVSPPAVVASGVQRGSWSDFYEDWLDVAQAGPADAVVRWSVGRELPYMQTTIGCGTVFTSPIEPNRFLVWLPPFERAGLLASNGRNAILVRAEPLANYSSAMALRTAPHACDPTMLRAAPYDFLTRALPEQGEVSIVAGNYDALVAWSESGLRHARRVSHGGQVLGWMTLPEDARSAHRFRVATNGEEYVAFWIPEEGKAIRFAKLVGPDEAQPEVKTLAALTDSVDGFDAEWSGSSYVVVWPGEGLTYGGNETVYGARVGDDGGVLDREPFEIVPPDRQTRRVALELSRGTHGMLLAWHDAGAGTGLPCGGCTNPKGVRVLRLGYDARPAGSILELSDWYNRMGGVASSEDAWYVVSQNGQSNFHRISRIDERGVQSIDTHYEAIAAFSLGVHGVGLFDGSKFVATSDDSFHLYDLPGGGVSPATEASFARVRGSRVLAAFTRPVDEAPHAGAHRVFVAVIDFDDGGSRQRRTRH